MKSWSYLWIAVLLLSAAGAAKAQSPVTPGSSKAPGSTQPNPIPSNSVKAALAHSSPAGPAGLISATREYKANSEDLLRLQEDEIKKASQKLEQLRQLVSDGLVARNELEAAEQSLAALQCNARLNSKKDCRF